MAPLFYNFGQIIGALIFSPAESYTFGPVTLPALGMGVHGLVYGVILGAVLHLGIQIPGLVRYHFHWTPSLKLDEGVIKVLKLITPRIATMFAIQLIFIVRDNLASQLPVDFPGWFAPYTSCQFIGVGVWVSGPAEAYLRSLVQSVGGIYVPR